MNISRFIAHVERLKTLSSAFCITCAVTGLALLDSPTLAPYYFFVAAFLFASSTYVAGSLLRAAKMRRFRMRRAKRIARELKVS